MHTAQVTEWGQQPAYVEVDTPEEPADSRLVQIRVLTAGIHQVVRSRAAGRHYSAKNLPHVPGVDGIGVTSSGQKVYFITFNTGGSFTEIVNVPKHHVTPLPEGIDPIQAAAFVNPAMSSWMALKMRAENLPSGFSVLIMGVTSASGRIAVSLARAFGAKRIIGVARREEEMAKLGLEESIVLKDPVSETDFSKLGDVDVVLDYLYGSPAEHLLQSLASSRPVQYVHIGSLAGLEITLPGSVLRSKNLIIRGSGPGSWKMADLGPNVPGLLEAFKNVESQPVKVLPLKDIEIGWNIKDERVVFTP